VGEQHFNLFPLAARGDIGVGFGQISCQIPCPLVD
jgi:hypothetical protein